jgi:flagellar assembly factor FliW
MGKNDDDLVKLYNYIAYKAPVIIHFHANKHMQYYIKDTHYRNQFETGHTHGSNNLQQRTGW